MEPCRRCGESVPINRMVQHRLHCKGRQGPPQQAAPSPWQAPAGPASGPSSAPPPVRGGGGAPSGPAAGSGDDDARFEAELRALKADPTADPRLLMGPRTWLHVSQILEAGASSSRAADWLDGERKLDRQYRRDASGHLRLGVHTLDDIDKLCFDSLGTSDLRMRPHEVCARAPSRR